MGSRTQRPGRGPSEGEVDQEKIRIEHYLEQQDPGVVLAEIREGLLKPLKELPTKLFYDDRGSELFEKICELPEYYQTRSERALLASVADDVVARSAADELVELGSGAATKTRVLLDAMQRAGRLRLFVPFDVNEAIVRRTAEELTALYPGLHVHGFVADFSSHLTHLPDSEHRLVVFLGGTIGNLTKEAARDFITRLSGPMSAGDCFLLGVDLVKDVARLEAAYNDSQGVTAAFNLNILNVVNGLVRANFDPTAFEHRAFYNTEMRRIEMRLVSKRSQVVWLEALALKLELVEGEEIHTEISAKYDREAAERLFDGHLFEPVEWYTDPEELFGLLLARRL